ncbi:MAG: hypothetical protein PUP91_23650 [Rhizonema sp. PD37]|nr:hypothetical protein [Rhizonema sp. PD37]
MLRLEGGSWKSANIGNSLATYLTSRPVRATEVRGMRSPHRLYLPPSLTLLVMLY